MHLHIIKKLDLEIKKTSINTWKINNLKLYIYGMIVTSSSLKYQEKMSHDFELIFLLTDISIDNTLIIFFLIQLTIKLAILVIIFIKKYIPPSISFKQ